MRGRKRKQNAKRYPDGRTDNRESVEEIRSVVVAQRLKHNVLKSVSNPFSGFPLDELYLLSKIPVSEYEAGAKLADLTWKRSQAEGFPLPFPKIQAYNQRFGRSLVEEDVDSVIRVREAYSVALKVLNNMGEEVKREVFRVVILEENPRVLDHLRQGLGALAKIFKLGG